MNHQSDLNGLYVENPLELQMLFGEKLFLDPNDVVISDATSNPGELGDANKLSETHLPIAIFLELEKTLSAGVNELPVLFGKILSITQLDGKIPTMELAEMLDLTNISFDAGEVSVLLVPSVMVITGNMEIKKEFAHQLKKYFLES